jgi:mannan endo-1,4-beta-mannosidase
MKHWFAICALMILAVPASAPAAPSHALFVRVHGTGLRIQDQAYHYVGTNFWYGLNLAASGPSGDRPRLARELDRLQKLGIGNLRIMAATEGPDSEPWRIVPALQSAPGVFNADLLHGLDFLLSEMGKRGMRAVLCLNNFWPWSGGMSQYLQWAGAGTIPYPPPQPGGDWGVYQSYTARFYSNEQAMALAENFMRTVITRKNEYTGLNYTDDPTIMAWELANEPRGGSNTRAFDQWLERTAAFIKRLDPDHLVTTGSEGETPSAVSAGNDFQANHRFKNIDYATAHIWAQNWGWFDPAHAEATYAGALEKMKSYFADHLTKSKLLGKPIVIEEFGLGRDSGSFDPTSSTVVRDRYYTEVFEQIWQAASRGEPAAGVNFWAWAGEARPRAPFGSVWKPSDSFIGDPPHEFQGWYSVYDADLTTARIISDYASRMRNLKAFP